jgi:hypothetical protein
MIQRNTSFLRGRRVVVDRLAISNKIGSVNVIPVDAEIKRAVSNAAKSD